jgi:uridylate kinase
LAYTKLLAVSLGATICRADGSFDSHSIGQIAGQLGDLTASGYFVVATVGLGGTGRAQRQYAAKYLGRARSKELDLINIELTRINAQLVIASLRSKGVRVYSRPLTTVREVRYFLSESASLSIAAVGVMGGLKPGLTSDSTALTLGKELNCPCLIVSTAGAIYDRNPKEPGARKLERIDRKYIQSLVQKPPAKHVLDVETCKLLLSNKQGRSESMGTVIAVTGSDNISKFPNLIEGPNPEANLHFTTIDV